MPVTSENTSSPQELLAAALEISETAAAIPMQYFRPAIVDYVINVLAKKYRVRGIGIDQSGAAAIIARLRREFGEDSEDKRELADDGKRYRRGRLRRGPAETDKQNDVECDRAAERQMPAWRPHRRREEWPEHSQG